MFIPVGDFAPEVDGNPVLYDRGTVAINTIPLDSGYDGPIRHPANYSTTITGTVVGAFSAAWPSLSRPTWIFGTATELKRTETSGTVTDVTGAATISSATAWTFAQFGGVVVATDYANTPRAFSLSGGTSFALISDAPKAKYVATVEPGFVMLGYYNDGSAEYPSGVRWSGINDHTSWPTIGTAAAAAAQSDAQTLPANSPITGIAPAVGGASAVIFTERGIFRADYVGPPSVFSFREVNREYGCVAPRSLVTTGGIAYFLSEQGFCAFDGSQVIPIGKGRVDRRFFEDASPNMPDTNIDWNSIWGAVDPSRKIIVWAFPASGSTTPDVWLIYSYATNRWRRASASQIRTDCLFTADFGNYATIAGVRSGVVVTWSKATNTAIIASVATGYTDAGPGSQRRVFVSGVRPLTDCASATAQVVYKDTLTATPSATPATTPGSDGVCPQRVSARYVAAKMNLPSSSDWSYVMGFDVIMRPAGRR